MEKLRNELNEKMFEVQEDMNKEWNLNGDTPYYRSLERDLKQIESGLKYAEEKLSKRLEWGREQCKLAGKAGQKRTIEVTHDSVVKTQDHEVASIGDDPFADKLFGRS